jgi:hypothetical protein
MEPQNDLKVTTVEQLSFENDSEISPLKIIVDSGFCPGPMHHEKNNVCFFSSIP